MIARWVAGPDAGGTVLLDAPVLVGRAPTAAARVADPTVAPLAALLVPEGPAVRLEPLAPGEAARRLEAGDAVALGDSLLVVGRPPADEAAVVVARRDRAVLCRPPRPSDPGPLPEPAGPPPPPEPPTPAPLPVGPLVAAATTGLVLAALTGHALVAVAGGVGGVATLLVAVGARWRVARRHAAARRAWVAECTASEERRRAWRDAEARRRRAAPVGLPDAVARLRDRSSRLWERRPDHADAFHAVVGWGDDGELVDVPIAVDLGPGRRIGLTSRDAARSLVVQLVAWHGPADLAVVVRSDDEGAWPGWRSLPHAAGHLPTDRHVVVVLDGDRVATDADERAALAARPDVSVIAVTWRREALPAGCDRVVAGGRATRARPALLAEAAARLADLDDPERPVIPASVDLDDLPSDGPGVAIGAGPEGPVTVDLDRDGPHVLVGGTTGSGKSELLRALVAAMARQQPPTEVTFLLVDYKGGAAFDALEALPHVVGVVTDLDGGLAERVTRSLEAEVRRRERLLRDAGVRDAASGRRAGLDLPRLVVVVDELATLVAEVPAFVTSLIAVAQRGRSLGLHLVLATQRPAGAVREDVRANIALRTTDRQDALDVVGDPAPASFDRPGLAMLRRGDERVTFQVARVGELVLPPHPHPRRPWLDPLPDVVAFAGACGTIDDPDAQAQPPLVWPGRGLLVVGPPGSGTTTALRTVALAAAAERSPADLHLHMIGPVGLDALPHCGAAVVATDRDRQARLWRHVRREVERRLSGATGPTTLVVVDRLDARRAAFDEPAGLAVLDDLQAVLAEGPSVDVHVVASSRRALPAAEDCWHLGSPPGRVTLTDGRAAQVALSTAEDVRTVAAQWAGSPRTAERLAALPTRVRARCRPGAVLLGLDDDLAEVAVRVRGGDHLLVVGPSGSGRTTALALLAEQLHAAGWTVHRLGDGDVPAERPLAVLVDDAERVSAEPAVLADHDVVVIAAARTDALRGGHGHWTQSLRRRRRGLLLMPAPDDGDVLGVVLPRRPYSRWVPGRAELVLDGPPRLVQLAVPTGGP